MPSMFEERIERCTGGDAINDKVFIDPSPSF
jgi:hypothetical protein